MVQREIFGIPFKIVNLAILWTKRRVVGSGGHKRRTQTENSSLVGRRFGPTLMFSFLGRLLVFLYFKVVCLFFDNF